MTTWQDIVGKGQLIAEGTIPGVFHKYYVYGGNVVMLTADCRAIGQGSEQEFRARLAEGRYRARLVGGGE